MKTMVAVKLTMDFPAPDLSSAAKIEKVIKGLVLSAAEQGAKNIVENVQFKRRREVPPNADG